MDIKKFGLTGCMILLAFVFFGSNCTGAKSKCIIIVKEGGKAEFKSVLTGGSAANAGWRSGNVVAFRETQSVPVPGGASTVSGKAGEVYQIDDQNQLKKIGDFDLKMSDGEVNTKFGRDCG